MASIVESILKGIVDYAKSDNGRNMIKNTTLVAPGAGAGAVVGCIKAKKEDEVIIKQEKKASFQAGIYKGLELSEEQIKYNILARVAVLYYIAWADGEIQKEEKDMIEDVLYHVTRDVVIEELNQSLESMAANKKIDFEFVRIYLSEVTDEHLADIMQDIYVMANACDGMCEAEIGRIKELENYATNRVASGELREYIKGVSVAKIQESVEEYETKMTQLDDLFSQKTQLNKKEISLVIAAVALQASRIYFVDKWTQIEKAGSGKREDKLHDIQKKKLDKFKDEEDTIAREYYAPMMQIVTTQGVPYDITAMGGPRVDIFNASEKGKGANHRFSTLGHDPIIGLLVGTVNIMTNTITTTREDMPFPMTYHIKYDESYKNGKIYGVPPASFVQALESVGERCGEDLKPLIAALLKQIIHIATDLYTPVGIQLPGANLILTRENTEVLTSYVSAGDVLKFGASKGIEGLIDAIILFLHGCMIMESGEPLENEINKAKAKKILLYSKAIVQSSNVLLTAVSLGAKKMDWAGYSTFINNCFSDIKFIYDLKHEFVRYGLDEQYNLHYNDKTDAERDWRDKVCFVIDDIAHLNVDCIVNSANRILARKEGAINRSIHAAAGPRLLNACNELGECEIGECKVTYGYDLPAKYIVHTVGPMYGKSNHCRISLQDCYCKPLLIATERRNHKVAFPIISSGHNGFPIGEVMECAYRAFENYFLEYSEYDMTVYMCCYNQKQYEECRDAWERLKRR